MEGHGRIGYERPVRLLVLRTGPDRGRSTSFLHLMRTLEYLARALSFLCGSLCGSDTDTYAPRHDTTHRGVALQKARLQLLSTLGLFSTLPD